MMKRVAVSPMEKRPARHFARPCAPMSVFDRNAVRFYSCCIFYYFPPFAP